MEQTAERLGIEAGTGVTARVTEAEEDSFLFGEGFKVRCLYLELLY